MATQIDKVRDFIRNNPTADNKTISEKTGVNIDSVKAYISRDLKQGRLTKLENIDEETNQTVRFLDYGEFMTNREAIRDAKDYKKKIYRQMAQMIYEAAERGEDVDNLVKASREIRNTLERIK
ncbi:hypothetical protein ACT5YR_06965 [Fructobacillus fructosus]|uniref:Phage protein n=1 Tax=Fructobacillus fructosus TaxID=1631 RepID=A0ABM9MM64_9LACO|nr:hypothetical protein [Fructobacillus sp. CRL 2054]MDD9138351.1 hypothetical protein [Fructobacillus sp. CRL 2054]CAK1224627.1 unnamed protein product [Fructobacillus fructosus]